ncbi:MAG: PEP-CTERM sorting domain-containing protein [Chthoniobacteraceae bacterium]
MKALKTMMALPAILGLATIAHAANFSGSYSQNFDSMGTSGTAAPTGWSVYSIAGSHDTFSYWTPSGGYVTALPASSDIAGATAASSTLTAGVASTQKGAAGYNFSDSTTTSNRALGSSPSGNAMTLLQLTLTNTTGDALTDFNVSYDIRRFTTTTTNNSTYTGGPYSGVEELPGYWLWYSLDSGATWTNVSALNPTLSGTSGVVVPNTVGTTSVPTTDVSLSSAWANGSTLLLRWSDDNAQSPSPDQLIGLDNVVLTTTAAPEPTSAAMLGLGLLGFLRRRRPVNQ